MTGFYVTVNGATTTLSGDYGDLVSDTLYVGAGDRLEYVAVITDRPRRKKARAHRSGPWRQAAYRGVLR